MSTQHPSIKIPRTIRMNERDNVAIIVNDNGLPPGARFESGLVLREFIPQGHKVSLQDIAADQEIVRYGVVIGYATRDLPAGSWVSERVIRMPEPPSLDELPVGTAHMPPASALDGYTFEGFRNADGSVGTRNILGISETVQCVAGVVEFALERIRRELLPNYPNVDGVVALKHGYGCGVAIDAPGATVPIRTLRNIARNPNFGGEVMLVSLGCEKLQPARMLPEHFTDTEQRSAGLVRLQDEQHVGFNSMVESIMGMARGHLERLNQRQRETCPASDLVVGMQCGGSDAFSGVTANPALGFAADLLVRAGATVMFSEVTEVRDGIDQLTARAASPEVAQALVREMGWYDEYLGRGHADRSANTTPGNKRGGLSNIVEKAMGSIVKSGSSPIRDVIGPGERVESKGLVFAATPAGDFVCGTLQLAAGMTIHIFTTGRGTPYGLAEVPVIKVATRTELAQRWHDLMDVDAGRIATGEASIDELGWELFRLILDVASGRKTWAEHWGIANDLVLFNPGPVT